MDSKLEGSIEFPGMPDFFLSTSQMDDMIGCRVCGAACLPMEVVTHCSFPTSSWWLHKTTLLVDKSLFWFDGPREERLSHIFGASVEVRESASAYLAEQRKEGRTDETIERVPARPLEHGHFLLSAGSREVQLPDGRWNRIERQTDPEPVVTVYDTHGFEQPLLYFPVHDSCLDLLDQFMATTDNENEYTHAGSILEVWDIWRLVLQFGFPSEGCENGFCALWARIGKPDLITSWTSSTDDFWNGLMHKRYPTAPTPLYLANPHDVPNYTSALVDLAPRLPHCETRPNNPKFMQLLQNLPAEMFENIIDFLRPFTDAPPTCTRVLEAVLWRKLLLRPRFIPFLWDLDAEALLQAPENIDWEAFARLFSSPINYTSDNIVGRLPPGLLNRVSIWRSLQQLRPPDESRFTDEFGSAMTICRPVQIDDTSPYRMSSHWKAARPRTFELRYEDDDEPDEILGKWSIKWRREEPFSRHMTSDHAVALPATGLSTNSLQHPSRHTLLRHRPTPNLSTLSR